MKQTAVDNFYAQIKLWFGSNERIDNIYAECKKLEKEQQKQLLIEIMQEDEKDGLYDEEISQEEIERKAAHYAHNWFDMHETNNYKALFNGFVEGVKWYKKQLKANKNG